MSYLDDDLTELDRLATEDIGYREQGYSDYDLRHVADGYTVRALVKVVRAAQNVTDRRTLSDDGFWVSKKELFALDEALAALSKGA